MSGSTYTQTFGSSAVVPAQPSFLALTLTASATALVWPLESTAASPAVAAAMNITASSTFQTLNMPPGNTGSNGVQSMITNVGSNTFSVTDQAGNAICTIAAGQAWLILLTNNSTANGTWTALQMASTTSSASAASLAGGGLQANGAALQTYSPTVANNGSLNIVASNRGNLLEFTGATPQTWQFNASTVLTSGWYCAVTNQGTAALTLACTGGDTINGSGTLVLQPGNSGWFFCTSGTGFVTAGALVSIVPITLGGTGATSAAAALTNLGGTSIGTSIFTAASAAAVRSLLGLSTISLTESTVSTNQALNPSSGNLALVCTAGLTVTLPLTASCTTQFLLAVYAQGGAVVLSPQAADKINGGSAGASFTVAQTGSLLLVTDAAGNWWPLYLSGGNIVGSSVSVSGNATIAGSAQVGNGLAVLNGANLMGGVEMSGGAAVVGGLNASGGITGDSLDVTGATTISGALTGGSTASFTGAVTIGGASTVVGALGVASNATVAGTMSVTGAATVGGAMSVGGAATVTGLLTASPGGAGNQVVNLSQFPSTGANPGSFAIPSGYRVKFGSGSVGGAGTTPITFDAPFPTQCFVVTPGLSYAGSGTPSAVGVAAGAWNASGFELGTSAACSFSWVAIGN